MLPSLEGMEPVDYARYVAIVVAFLVTSLGPQKTFLRADVMFSVGMGIGWLCFPNVFLDFQVSGARNPAHVLYGRCMGLCFLMSALPIILNKRTRDDKVYTSIHLTRFLGYSMMLFSLFYCHWKFSKSEVRLTARQFWFTGLAIAGWMFGNLRHLLVSSGAQNYSRRQPENQLKYHLFCDVFCCLPATLYMFAFGQLTFVQLKLDVSQDDGFLVFTCCAVATLGVTDCLYVLSSHTFDDQEAVENVFKFRVLAVVAYTLMQLAHNLLQTPVLVMLFVTYGALLANSMLALRYLNQQTKAE